MTIQTTLNTTGARAVAPKSPRTCRAALVTAVRQMTTRNGRSRTVSSRTAAGSGPSQGREPRGHTPVSPGTASRSGSTQTTAISATVRTTRIPVSIRNTAQKKARPALSPSSPSTSENSVWNEVAMAPSPKSRRKRLGIRQAVRNASRIADWWPNRAAVTASRA